MQGDILRTRGLKQTPIRMEILSIFGDYNFALSASDIASKLKINYDRVTLYRALASFEKKGIIHKASEDGNGVKYALCGQGCHDHAHVDQHAHFVCDKCHKTYCMEEVTIPQVQMHNDFSISRVDYTIHGTCKECNS